MTITRDEEMFAMTTNEAIWALKAILNATWMNYNYNVADDPTAHLDVPMMNDEELAQCDSLFRGIVGEVAAERLANYFMQYRVSPEDAHAIASDAGELMKLAAVIGITQ